MNRIVYCEFEKKEDSILFKELLLRVSVEKRERIVRMRSDIDKILSLYAEIIVRNIASEFLNIGNSDIEIIRGKYGKPYLKGYANFHFNVSHTHNAIAVAVADTPIGIDIERIRPLNDSIVKRLYSFKEKEYVYGVAGEEERRFSEVWTRKESYIKRDDRNISLGSFSIDTFKDVIDGQIKTYCIGKYVISVCGNQAVEKFDLINQEKFRSMISWRKV